MWLYISLFFGLSICSELLKMDRYQHLYFSYNYYLTFMAFVLFVMLYCNCNKQAKKVSDNDLTIMWQTRSEEKLIWELFSGRSGVSGGSSSHLSRIREGELLRPLRKKWHHQSHDDWLDRSSDMCKLTWNQWGRTRR